MGLTFAYVALISGKNTPAVAAYAALGLTLGSLLSAAYLILAKKRAEKSEETSGGYSREKILPTLVKLSLPVSLSAAVISLARVVDMTVILRRLQTLGGNAEDAFAAYGNYTTLALPLFGVAPAFVGAVALPLIPELSRAAAERDRVGEARAVGDALRLTSLISMPVSVGLVLFPRPILELIFRGESEAIAVATPLLAILGFSVTLSCLVTVTNSILQAYSSPTLPVVSMAVGSALKLALAYFLIGNPKIGLLGAPISTFFCDLAINFVNFAFIRRKIDEMPRIFDVMIKPLLSAVLSVGGARVLYNIMAERLGESAKITLTAIGFAACGYLILSICTGVLKKEDLPFLNKKNIIIKKEE